MKCLSGLLPTAFSFTLPMFDAQKASFPHCCWDEVIDGCHNFAANYTCDFVALTDGSDCDTDDPFNTFFYWESEKFAIAGCPNNGDDYVAMVRLGATTSTCTWHTLIQPYNWRHDYPCHFFIGGAYTSRFHCTQNESATAVSWFYDGSGPFEAERDCVNDDLVLALGGNRNDCEWPATLTLTPSGIAI